MRRFAILLALALAVPTWAGAQEDASGSTYVAIKAGPIMPKAKDLDGFDNGLSLEGTVGYRASENLAFEAGLGRFAMRASQSGYVYTSYVNVTVDLIAYPVTGSVKLIAPMDKAQLYALAGAGLYFFSNEGKVEMTGYPTQTTQHSESAFALHLGAGIDFSVSPNVRLGAEMRYLIGKVDAWGTGTKYDFDSLVLGAALAYQL